jgi:hypothetical protein
MASANVFSLFNHPNVELLDPYELQRRKFAIANALAAQQIQQQQIQTGAIGLEQAQRDQAADAALRAAMGGGDPRAVRAGVPAPGVPAPAGAPPPTPAASVLPGAAPGSAAWSPGLAAPALAPPPAGGDASTSGPGEMLASGASSPAAAAPPAPHELSDQEILGLMGAKGYGLITARNAAREKQAAYQKAAGEVELHDRDYWGSLAYAVQHSGGDPGVLQATLSQAAADGKQNTPQFQAIAGALRSGDGALVQSLISQAIAASPEQQKALFERTNAESRKAEVGNQTRKTDQELFTQKLASTGQLLSTTRSKAEWDDVLGRVDDPKVKAEFAQIPWSPQAPAAARQKGLNPEQQTQAGQAAINAAEAARHNKVDEGLRSVQVGLEKQRLDWERGGGATVDNPLYMQGVVNGTIQINPRDKNFAAISAAAKAQDPTWSSDRYNNRMHYYQSITSGTLGRQLTSLNQGLAHLGEYKAASDRVGMVGAMTPGLGRVSGDVQALNDATDTAGHELTTMFAQGKGGEAETFQTQRNLRSWTQDARNTGVKQYANLIAGRVRAVAKQHAAATGEAFPVDRFIDSAAIDFLKSQGVDVYQIADDESKSYLAKSAGGGGAPAAAAPAPHGIPDLGSTFNGGRVLKVTPIP